MYEVNFTGQTSWMTVIWCWARPVSDSEVSC